MPFFQSKDTTEVRGVCDGRNRCDLPVTRIGFVIILHCKHHILKIMVGQSISLLCRTRAVLSKTLKRFTGAPFLYQPQHQPNHRPQPQLLRGQSNDIASGNQLIYLRHHLSPIHRVRIKLSPINCHHWINFRQVDMGH